MKAVKSIFIGLLLCFCAVLYVIGIGDSFNDSPDLSFWTDFVLIFGSLVVGGWFLLREG